MVTVTINGIEITVDDGTLILDAAREAGFEIPTFCYQADLLGVGSCRMCIVEIEGQKKLQPSCVTPVMHGMNIQTETPTVQSARSAMLEFLLSNHALDCPVCDKGGECELQDMVYTHGPRKGRHAEPKYRFHEKDYQLSPVIVKNSNRCVQCMKCVRVCREVVGANVLAGMNRGHHQEETSFLRTFLDCDQCGNCIEVCPVGCFMRVPFRYKTRPWDLVGADSVCSYCATGCRIKVEHRDGTVMRSKAQLGVGINSETLCARGRFGYDVMQSEERITSPMVRRNGTLVDVSWEEALEEIRANLRPGLGEKAGGVASARLTNEELYLFGRLMRGIIGTPNVDSSSRWTPEAVEDFIGATDMASGGMSVYDCMEADSVLVVGTHLSEENPITDYIVRRTTNFRFLNVMVASPRAMKLDSSAGVSVRHNPATEGALLGAVVMAMSEKNPTRLADFTPLRALEGRFAELTAASGVTSAEIDELATRLANSESVSIIAGTEFLRYPEGAGGLAMIRDALRAMGKKVCMLPALDRCNQRGAWDMGVHPGFASGYRETRRGLGTTGMLSAAAEGRLDAMYVAGADIAALHRDGDFVREALGKLSFLVVQDIFLTDTARLAHVVLPAAAWAEKNGTFTNQEGRVQKISRLLPPPGKARTDLGIFRSVGRLFDKSFGAAPDEIFKEIRLQNMMYQDVSLKFNNKRNKKNELDTREALIEGSSNRVRSAGAGVAVTPTAATATERPFVLMTGNHFFHGGTYSTRSEILKSITKGEQAEISAEDAAELGLREGETVKVTGEHHEATLKLKVVEGSKRGVIFIPENFPGVSVNRFYKAGGPLPRVAVRRA